MQEDSILFTSQNNRIHLDARDGIRAVRINEIVPEDEMTLVHYPALRLAVIDESDLVLWSDELYKHIQPEAPGRAFISRTFAVWGSLTISIKTMQELPGLRVRVHYTLNPE